MPKLTRRVILVDFRPGQPMSALPQIATKKRTSVDVRFSNRPVGVKHFRLSTVAASTSRAGSRFSPESAPGPFHHGDPRTRWNDLSGGLAVRVTAGPSRHANSPHPSSREGHHSTAGWSSSFLLLDLILYRVHAAAACSLVHLNSVPSTQMRCMITASRRAKATIAFFSPRRLAICMAQALSQDHFVERTSTMWAAS